MNKYDFTFKALGTVCSISIVKENNLGLNQVINDIYDFVLNFENEFSRFKKESILSKLNLLKKFEVSDLFLNLLLKTREMYLLGEGYFNPLVNVSNIGYSNNFLDSKFEKTTKQEDLSFDKIKNYGNLVEIGENMNLDFGSIAKGYLGDLVKEKLLNLGFKNFLLNFGGDIVVSGLNQNNQKWKIAIPSPKNQQEMIHEISITNKSISTSGIYLRKWQIGQEKFHHIKNPFSNIQQNKLQSVSVIDFYGYKTDALATTILAMGYEKGLEFCKKNKINYVFILFGENEKLEVLNG